MSANWENDMDIQNLEELEAALTRLSILKNTGRDGSCNEVELNELEAVIHAFDNEHLQFEPE